MTVPSPEYLDRIIVFLDFLGFREHIKRSADDPAHVARIAHAIDTIRKYTEKEDYAQSAQVTQFSDCVVVSYEAVEPSAVFNLLMDISLLQVELASYGFLVRGGVTSGQLVHSETHLFGPAMVEAYRLESEVAKFPRVIVDPELVSIASDYPALHHDGKDEVSYVLGFLSTDSDGALYTDYVSYQAVVIGNGATNEDYPGYLGRIATILAQGLKSTSNSVLEKMLWLHARYDAAIRYFFEPPRDAATIAKHADFYEALADLPGLKVEADTARAILKAAHVSEPASAQGPATVTK